VLAGRLNSQSEAVVRLWIRGPAGQALEADVVVDTGFNGFLTLPLSQVKLLGLIRQGHGVGVLADGTRCSFEVYEAIVLWHGKSHVITVDSVESDPLLGMGMLFGSELAMQVVEGGEVIIHELPVS
jgi:clan AA aspartic protease